MTHKNMVKKIRVLVNISGWGISVELFRQEQHSTVFNQKELHPIFLLESSFGSNFERWFIVRPKTFAYLNFEAYTWIGLYPYSHLKHGFEPFCSLIHNVYGTTVINISMNNIIVTKIIVVIKKEEQNHVAVKS